MKIMKVLALLALTAGFTAAHALGCDAITPGAVTRPNQVGNKLASDMSRQLLPVPGDRGTATPKTQKADLSAAGAQREGG